MEIRCMQQHFENRNNMEILVGGNYFFHLCKVIPIHDYQPWITDARSPIFTEERDSLYTG